MLEGHDGLIPVPERVLEGRGRRATAVAIVLLFSGVLAGTGLVDTLFPAPRPILEGQEAEQDAARRRAARLADGTLASLYEYDRRVASSVRRTVMPPYARALYRWFRFAKSEIVVGRDGWMFLRVRSRLGPLQPLEATERAALRLAALDRALAARGTQLVVAPIPRKSALYRDRMPLGVDPVPELERLFERALERRGITYAPILERYEEYLDSPEAEAGDPLYYKVGTHWTPRAELIAAEAIARAAGLWRPEEERRSTIVAVGKMPQETDHFTFAGIDRDRETDARLAGAQPVVGLKVAGPRGAVRPIGTNPEQVGRVALAGTSFSAHRRLSQFLSHFIRGRVYNAARPGVIPITPVLDLLGVSEPGRPEVLVLELPGHTAFLNDNLRMVEDAYAAIAPPALYALTLERRWSVASELEQRAPLEIGRRTRLATLSAGSVAHDGGGVLAVRVRGTLQGEPVRIVVMKGSERSAAEWTPGRGSVLVPLIMPAPGAAAVHVSAERTGAGATLVPGGLELVATFARDSAWPGAVAPGDPSQPAETLVEFRDVGPLPRRATLVVALTGPRPPGPVRLAAEVDGTWHELGRFSGLARRGTIFASLAGHAGGLLTRVRASGVSAEHVDEAYVAPQLPGGG